MTRLVALFFLILLPAFASANPVQVQSGEHDGFTRLVLDYGQTVDWQLGRSPDGYALHVTSTIGYDFTQVFDLIGKGRLAAIWADPENGDLRIGIACACHAIPFEFRPGIVVIDLKDGAPPSGSSFEMALNGDAATALPKHTRPRPRARPALLKSYDWLNLAVSGSEALNIELKNQNHTGLLDEIDPTMEPLRAALLRQLGRGAAQGVVDMTLPKDAPSPSNESGSPSVQIRIGELPGVTAEMTDTGKSLTASGNACPPASSLAISDWGDDRPISQQIADSKQGLIGEFDKPNSETLSRAIKFNLFIGFGAEVRQLLEAFPVDHNDTPLWRSLSLLLDNEPDIDSAFAELGACNSSAAMWAILSQPASEVGITFNREAALLAFSALPIHLRQLLGPRLASRFLELEDAKAARAVRDAILRAPSLVGVETDLLMVEMDMKHGNPKSAELKLVDILANAGPHMTEALIAYVDSRIAQSLPISADTIPALESMLIEQSGSEDFPRVQRALALAHAASGDFSAAFATTPEVVETEANIWRILAYIGEDAAILEHAILAEKQPRAELSVEVSETLAWRLLNLGFAHDAARWLNNVANPDSILAAKISLSQGDAQSALTWLDGLTEPEALTLRALALQGLGDNAAAAKIYSDSGAETLAQTTMIHARDWAGLSEKGSDPWKAATAMVLPALGGSPTPGGPLARGHSLIDESTNTRIAIGSLLHGVPIPAQP
jgi:tetratricopeptide (TPR) repeat protein